MGTATIQRMEVMDGVPAGDVKTLVAIQQALEGGGIEFIGKTLTTAPAFAFVAARGDEVWPIIP